MNGPRRRWRLISPSAANFFSVWRIVSTLTP
jgi:hypothetical protein